MITVPRNQPYDILGGLYLQLGSDFQVLFEFDGPVTSIKSKGYIVDGDPSNLPNYGILESLNGNDYTLLGTSGYQPWTTQQTLSTSGEGRFKFVCSSNSGFNNSAYYYFTVLGT